MALGAEAPAVGLRAQWCGVKNGVRLARMRYQSVDQAVAVVALAGCWSDVEKARDAVRAWRAAWL